jgi:hypothetical protein
MATYKSLLVGLRWVEAGKARKCYHSKKHAVSKGDRVLEVKVGMGWFGYCEACGYEMLRLASAELATFQNTSARS